MLRILFSTAILIAAIPAHSHAQTGDSPETLEWVKRTATKIETNLNGAVNSMDWAYLLIKLMETNDDFEAIALAGPYCHEARKAAELGRSYANWLNTYSMDKDLNACIVRASEARLMAIRMREAADYCLQSARQTPPDTTFLFTDLFLQNAEAIGHDIGDGIASEDFHILAQKLEHAVRIFHNTEIMAATLLNCEDLKTAAKKGLIACTEAMLNNDWDRAVLYARNAAQEAEKIGTLAGVCR